MGYRPEVDSVDPEERDNDKHGVLLLACEIVDYRRNRGNRWDWIMDEWPEPTRRQRGLGTGVIDTSDEHNSSRSKRAPVGGSSDAAAICDDEDEMEVP
jgi:hypothetical protein